MEEELLDIGGRSDLWNYKMNFGDGFNDMLIGSPLWMKDILCIIINFEGSKWRWES